MNIYRIFCFGIGLLLCGTLSGQTSAGQNNDFAAATFNSGMAAKFSLGVLYDQATGQTPAWGSGRNGLEKRIEWRMAGLLTRASAEYAVSRARGTGSVYARCQCRGFVPRSRHVLVSEFTEVRPDGSYAPPVARAAGIASAAGLTAAAEHAGVAGAVQRSAMLMTTDIGFNMLTEFWPEIKRTLLLRRKPANSTLNSAAR